MVQFIDLWRGHPINESVTAPCVAPHDLTNMEGQTVHMGFPVFHNQCAIRLGVALRRAGVSDGQIGGCASCAVHPRTDMHFINASQLANALTHAKPLRNGTVLVRWQEEQATLALSVSDGGGPTRPEAVEAAPDDVHGRGLKIVETLSAKWWVERSSRLRTVHVRLPLDSESN